MTCAAILWTAVAGALAACVSDAPRQPTAPSAGALTDTGVLFSDDFETGRLTQWPDGVDPSLHRVVTDPAGAQSGERYLAVTYPPGQDGGWLTAFLMPGHDGIHASYYVRFPRPWQGATKLIALYGSRRDDQWSALGRAGQCPNGSDFFATMLVTEPGGDPGAPLFYTYYPGMPREPDGRTCWGRFGDGSEAYVSQVPFQLDRWHRIDFEVHLNGPGRQDARQSFWVDGELRGTWSGFSFGDTDTLRLNAVQLTFSRSSGTAQPQTLHVDNVNIRVAR